MTDFRSEAGIGARVRAARKMRGLKSQSDLADAIDHESVTLSVLQNLEAGRKAELTVSQLLNIAFALKLPPSYLMAPLGRPMDGSDLPNLSVGISRMRAIEFDAWLSGLSGSVHPATTADEQSAISQLDALRSLAQLERERTRLMAILSIAPESDHGAEPGESQWRSLDEQLTETDRHIDRVRAYLHSAGWDTDFGMGT